MNGREERGRGNGSTRVTDLEKMAPTTESCVSVKEWEKKQASHCSITDFGLRQSLNQLYNNHKIAKLVLFSTAW